MRVAFLLSQVTGGGTDRHNKLYAMRAGCGQRVAATSRLPDYLFKFPLTLARKLGDVNDSDIEKVNEWMQCSDHCLEFAMIIGRGGSLSHKQMQIRCKAVTSSAMHFSRCIRQALGWDKGDWSICCKTLLGCTQLFEPGVALVMMKTLLNTVHQGQGNAAVTKMQGEIKVIQLFVDVCVIVRVAVNQRHTGH